MLILGEHDHDFPAQQFKFMARRYSDPKQVEIIDGADHFFGGHVAQVVGLATSFFEQWLGEQRQQP